MTDRPVMVTAVTTALLAILAAGVACAPEAPREAGAPTPGELAGASYQGIRDEPVRLDDGLHEGPPFVEGGASRPRVELVRDFRLTGDLDGDGGEEAVVLLSESSGGSGTLLYLAAVGRRQAAVVNLATVLVGDRVQVRSARLENRRIELDVVEAGPGDAMCCPSRKATRSWTLRGSELEEFPPALTGILSLADLAGPVWVLTHLDWNEEAPATPAITLSIDDGRVTGTSGCNDYFARIEERAPGDISVGPVGSTRRACPDTIMGLEARYLTALVGATRYGFLATRLVLTARIDDGLKTLLFARRAVAASAEASERESITEGARRRGGDFYGTGNEPGWTIEIGPDEIVFRTRYGEDTYRFPLAEPQIAAGETRTVYRARAGAHDLVVEIRGARCTDSMSGEEFDHTVRVTLDGQVYAGCGLALH